MSRAVTTPHTEAIRRRGVTFLIIFAGILFCVPRLSVKIGPLPLYAVDLLIFIVIYHAIRVPRQPGFRQPFLPIFFVILFFLVMGEVSAIIYSASVLEPLYILGRLLFALSLFFCVPHLIRDTDDLARLCKAVSVGVVITAILMIGTSLPQTRFLLLSTVFSLPFLEPGQNVATGYSTAYFAELGARGHTLVGVSILGATFLNIGWCITAVGLGLGDKLSRAWRAVAWAACFLAPLAVLMSYSRGPILGTILVFLMLFFFGYRAMYHRFVMPMAALLGFVAIVGVGSQILFIDRLVERGAAMFDTDFSHRSESERIFSYTEPFEHVAEHPQFLLLGQGTAINKTGVASEDDGAANHAMFSSSYYAYGMTAAFVYHILILAAWWYVFWHRGAARSPEAKEVTTGFMLMLAAIMPWLAFAHGAITAPRGTMMFFLIMGLLGVLRSINTVPAPAARPRPQPMPAPQFRRAAPPGALPAERNMPHGHGRPASV